MKKFLIITVFLTLFNCNNDGMTNQNNEITNPNNNQGINGLTVTYILNEGFLISCEGNKILIDALFKINDDVGPSSGVLNQMIDGQSPFDSLDLVLITHSDMDHFKAEYVSQFMENNNETMLIAPVDAKDAIEQTSSNFSSIESRIITDTPAWGETKQIVVENINIKVLGIPHSGSLDAKHRAYIIELGDFKLLHLGDSWESVDYFQAFHSLLGENIDVAFIPEWYYRVESGIAVHNRYLADCANKIAMHLPASSDFTYPNIIVMRNEMSVRQFSK